MVVMSLSHTISFCPCWFSTESSFNLVQADYQLISLSSCLYFWVEITGTNITPHLVYALLGSLTQGLVHARQTLRNRCSVTRSSKCWCPFELQLLQFLPTLWWMVWNTADSERGICSVIWRAASIGFQCESTSNLWIWSIWMKQLFSWHSQQTLMSFSLTSLIVQHTVLSFTVTGYYIYFKWMIP